MKAAARDHLNFANDSTIKKLLDPNDKVIFSGKLGKFNPYGIKQERELMVTNKWVYNLKGKSDKRRIALATIAAVTKSITKGSFEFVIHIPSEYDYRYVGELREEVIQTLKEQYLKNYGKNLPIYGVPEASLSGFVTTKKDKKESRCRIPAETFRLVKENLFMESSAKGPAKDDILSNLSQVKATLIYAKTPAGANVPLSSFKIARVLGKDENEREYLVESAGETKEILILRTIEKTTVLDTDAVTPEFVVAEVAKNAGHPFLLQPEAIYKGEGILYLLFKFMGGKNLAYILGQVKRLNERKVKFYGLQIASALFHLHTRGVVYRDLRPERILVDDKGYICLNDFGTYRFLPASKQKHYICSLTLKYPSRQEYLPPEHFLDQLISPAADWWSFGILLYEMLTGITPFYSEDSNMQQQQICGKQLNFPTPLKHHILLSDSARDLIARLLNKLPKERFGREAVLEHEFFRAKGWNKEKLLKKEADLKYVFLQKGMAELAMDSNSEEPITQLYPPVSKAEISKRFEQLQQCYQ
eukprot:TRINITY_DN105842_c1_g1_i1.p1 TRINITY_DN105842_c1_g1~~TRINITY_DN105842_c1_g1_i1.p1  ORF type:complete len:530 (-),score=62.70 TRINITY_DN105842_c1_g1_i1:52-1641(-)